MRITSGGNVGISKTAPSRILDAVGAAKATDTVITDKFFYGPTLRATNEIAVADGSGNELFGTWKHTGTDGFNTWSGYQSGHTVKLNGGGYSGVQGSYNTMYGYRAGYSNTTGYYNTFNGYQAGYSNTTGSNNTFNGMYAGYSNTTGYYNTFNGYQAGYSNTTGAYNTFNGMYAGYSNTTGYYNTFNGYQAGYSNTTGYSNTALGFWSLYNSTDYRNTAVGDSAGGTITTGNTNSFLGYKSGYNASQKNDAVNSTAIGANSYTNASNQISYGDANITEHRFRSGTVKMQNLMLKNLTVGTVNDTLWGTNGTGKYIPPNTFAPYSHTQDWSTITGAPGTYTPTTHTHSQYRELSNHDSLSKLDEKSYNSLNDKPTTWDWSNLTNIPGTFTPSSHTQSWSTITDPPGTYTPTTHTHADYVEIADSNSTATGGYVTPKHLQDSTQWSYSNNQIFNKNKTILYTNTYSSDAYMTGFATSCVGGGGGASGAKNLNGISGALLDCNSGENVFAKNFGETFDSISFLYHTEGETFSEITLKNYNNTVTYKTLTNVNVNDWTAFTYKGTVSDGYRIYAKITVHKPIYITQFKGYVTVNNSVKMYGDVSVTGNLAVGNSTSPSYKLDVNGAGRFSGALSLRSLSAGTTGDSILVSSGTVKYIPFTTFALYSHNHTWSSITDPPGTYTPTTHTHDYDNYEYWGLMINGVGDLVTSHKGVNLQDGYGINITPVTAFRPNFAVDTSEVATPYDLTSYVPYTGATKDVDLGTHTITTAQVVSDNFRITPQGGYAVKMIAGEDLELGDIVMMGSADGTVSKTTSTVHVPIGVVYADADSATSVWVVISGIATVKFFEYDAVRGTIAYSYPIGESIPYPETPNDKSIDVINGTLPTIGTYIESKSTSTESLVKIIVQPLPYLHGTP